MPADVGVGSRRHATVTTRNSDETINRAFIDRNNRPRQTLLNTQKSQVLFLK
jgi:hypothetical protein